MPLVIVLVPLVVLGLVLLVPFSLVQRYRVGTRRRRARPWLAGVNAWGFGLSLGCALAGAALGRRWLPAMLQYAVAGTACGCVLGLVGLLMTRWEHEAGVLHYTPSRTLVLSVTLLVAARLLYGWVRMYSAWTHAGGTGWIAQAGAEGSLAAGALVLAYYFTYWMGVRRRMLTLRQSPASGGRTPWAR